VKLKLDENLSRHLKHGLTLLGHDVATTADEGLLSQPDTIIATEAKREGRILLTLDIEFADLRKHPPGRHPGIILFRPRSFGPLAVNHFVEQFMSRLDLEPVRGCIVVVDATKVRVRRPPPE
jgi:predicted nuclease of predicted toxin-antitoxin system